MTNRAGPHVRLAQADDVAFLGAMLAEAVDWRPGTPVRPVTEVLGDPALARYVEGWPRAGDLGFVAVDGDQPLGAAWYRHFDGNQGGYGYVAADVPELAIGVRPEHRGRGLGRRLLDALVAEASARGVGRVSLSVELDNPSKYLYDRVGFEAVSTNRGSVTMVLDCARRTTASDSTASSEASVQVSPLEPGDGDVAVRVLTEAFWAYPETLHLLPDAVARRRVLPRYLASDVRDAVSHGIVDVARVGDEIVGAAVWLHPGAYPIGPMRQVAEAARLAPIAPWGFRALTEARRGQAANRAAHRAFPPHHWLRTLGVQPSHQGRGAGSALLRAGLERADHDGTGAFLFTATAANAAWYAAFGFDVATEYRPTPTWPITWAMWRTPSSAAA